MTIATFEILYNFMMKYLALFFFFLSTNCYSIKPVKEYIQLPSDYDIVFKEFFLEKNDYKICIWESNPKNVTKTETILLTYGDFGNMSYYIQYIKFYTDLGYRVIAFDYRGFGKSSSFEINEDFLYYNEFTEDLDNVILYCKENLKIDKLGVVALSMGTLLTSASSQKNNIDFLILESAVENVADVVVKLNKIKKIMYKLPKSNVHVSHSWKDFKCKIIIFTGIEDNITTKDDALKIINYNHSNRRMILYEGGHLSVLNSDNNRLIYLKELKKFLNE